MLVVPTLLVAAVAVSAPITSVTVYSDCARVTRLAPLSLSGTARVELPLLGDSIDADSLRVDGDGAEVRRVDIAHVDADDFPADEARKLLSEIEALDDKITRARALRDVPQSILDGVRALVPVAPREDPLKPSPRLNPAGWSVAFSFVDSWMEKMQARVRKQVDALRDLDRERQRLGEKARNLGGVARRSGYRITVLAAGSGKAKLVVTYMVRPARWFPNYDIQLVPADKKVNVAFSALVTQETGEDWSDAQLIVSTAVPATATRLPKLLTWKIGERERFIPTPIPVREIPRPAPIAVPLPPPEAPDSDELRARLNRLAAGERGKDDESVQDAKSRIQELEQTTDALKEQVFRSRSRLEMSKESVLGGAVATPSPAPAQPSESPPPAASAAPVEADLDRAESLQSAPMSRSNSSRGAAYKTRSAAAPTTLDAGAAIAAVAQVGLAPPPGYQPPYYGPDLPVSLAGGYDLSFPSARPETILSGGGARRVALFSQEWPVELERRLFPALAPEAYLTAEIHNPSRTALPGGTANLSVGDDPAGTANLKLVAPGEKFVLPLGLDRAIKPVRNVKLVQTEKGIINKDDFGEYTVTIEVANPYREPLPLHITDQLPLTDDKNVEVKPLGFNPQPAEQDKLKGSIEWRITVPASGKSILQFSYSIRRPKNWRLHQ